MKILITGTAGFIGFHLVEKLCREGNDVLGLDNINEYYDVQLKFDRLKYAGIDIRHIEYGKPVKSTKHTNYQFVKAELVDKEVIHKLFSFFKPDVVVNLAAQAGVRYSLTNPDTYIEANISGFLNILEACRNYPVKHLIYASSSSVYGLNKSMPFSVHKNVNHPVSLYAASKKSNELMAHTYSHLFGIPTTGLRFFTVYGPWGRPDMALFIFTKAMLANEPIEVFNYGKMERDFTYVDDIVDGIHRMTGKPPESDTGWNPESPDPASSSAPYRVYNIGNSKPVKLLDFIHAIEKYTGKKAIMNMQPMQPGDVEKTWADVDDLIENFDYKPDTSVDEGIRRFIDWYKAYYKN
ncbi:MAG TPA: NAD-dependent epimerase [Bacteroidales bacterium]|nr:NAD-dependent epimerase [Bacteroidales bacterium]